MLYLNWLGRIAADQWEHNTASNNRVPAVAFGERSEFGNRTAAGTKLKLEVRATPGETAHGPSEIRQNPRFSERHGDLGPADTFFLRCPYGTGPDSPNATSGRAYALSAFSVISARLWRRPLRYSDDVRGLIPRQFRTRITRAAPDADLVFPSPPVDCAVVERGMRTVRSDEVDADTV